MNPNLVGVSVFGAWDAPIIVKFEVYRSHNGGAWVNDGLASYGVTPQGNKFFSKGLFYGTGFNAGDTMAYYVKMTYKETAMGPEKTLDSNQKTITLP